MLKTLSDWQLLLESQVRRGELLLGELPLDGPPYNQEHLKQLNSLLLPHLNRRGRLTTDVAHTMRRYPLPFALYLVLQGIYAYHGSYWPAVFDDLGIYNDGPSSAALGEFFREILARYKLPTFEHVEGHRNLVPILAHGGIPNQSLPAFFELLQKSITDHLIQVDAETLIAEWRAIDSRLEFLSAPGRRFLLYGGAVARDFVARCLDLFLAEDEAEIFALNLPQRVLDVYTEWSAAQHVTQRTIRIRLVRPFLCIDPYGEGVQLGLPAQLFPYQHAPRRIRWHIETSSGRTLQETYRERTADGYEYATFRLLSVPPSDIYSVALEADDKILRHWALTGIWETPILFFDRNSGYLLEGQEQFRPGDRWILYPEGSLLTVSRGRSDTEPRHLYTWPGFAVQGWQLEPNAQIALRNPDIGAPISITAESPVNEPYLDSESATRIDRYAQNEFPLFTGKPPNLNIPIASSFTEENLSRWSLTIRASGRARPEERRIYRLSALKGVYSFRSNILVVDLSHQSLLGLRPFGKFEIRLIGPFGRCYTFGLRMLPELIVQGDDALYIEDPSAPAEYKIELLENMEIALRSPISGVQMNVTRSGSHHTYSVTADPDVTMIHFIAVYAGIEVPFRINVSRLKWRLQTGEVGAPVDWHHQPLRYSVKERIEGSQASIELNLPSGREEISIYCGWRLLDSTGKVLQERVPGRARLQGRYSILFGEFDAELQAAESDNEVLGLQAWIQQRTGEGICDYFIDLVHFLPHLELGEVVTELAYRQEHAEIILYWETPKALRNWHLVIWPLDQQWHEQPLELPLSSGVDRFHEWHLPIDRLPCEPEYQGAFIGQLVQKSLWTITVYQRPRTNDPHAVLFNPPQADAYYEGLRFAALAEHSPVLSLLTLLAYQHRTGCENEMHWTNRQLIEHFERNDMKPAQVILWLEQLEQIGDRNARKLAVWSVFNPVHIHRLLCHEWTRALRMRCLAFLPDQMPQLLTYQALLAIGETEVRHKCIRILCKSADPQGIDALLDEVSRGEIMVKDAIQLLKLSAKEVAAQLVSHANPVAQVLLDELIEQSVLPRIWLTPGCELKTSLGDGVIQDMRAVPSNEILKRCMPNAPALLRADFGDEDAPLPVVIDLSSRTMTAQVDSLVQCGVCSRLFSSQRALDRHHRHKHPMASLSFSLCDGKRVFPVKIL